MSDLRLSVLLVQNLLINTLFEKISIREQILVFPLFYIASWYLCQIKRFVILHLGEKRVNYMPKSQAFTWLRKFHHTMTPGHLYLFDFWVVNDNVTFRNFNWWGSVFVSGSCQTTAKERHSKINEWNGFINSKCVHRCHTHRFCNKRFPGKGFSFNGFCGCQR